MNKALVFVAFLISFLAQAQEETKFIVKEDFKEFYTEEYYVLKTDKTLKNGAYVKYEGNVNWGIKLLESGEFKNGSKEGQWEYFYNYSPWNGLKAKGRYKADKEEGLWEYYFRDTLKNDVTTHLYSSKKRKVDSIRININNEKKIIREIGYYQKGIKQGVWDYFCAPNILDQKYDHTTNQLLYDRKSNSIGVPGKETKTRPAMYIGGNYKMINFLLECVNMSLLMKEANSEKLLVNININKEGNAISYRIDKYDEKNILHKEALRVVEALPNTWLAQIQDGQPIASSYQIEVNFNVIHRNNNRGSSQLFFRAIN